MATAFTATGTSMGDNDPDGYILCWTKGGLGNTKKIKSKEEPGGHCLPVFSDSALGKAMSTCQSDTAAKYVLHKHMFPNAPNAFSKLTTTDDTGTQVDMHMFLNVGKEWIYRSLFSTGTEQIGENTGATFQSFQTRLKKDGEAFRFITHVSGCKNGECYCFDILHHFHFIKRSKVMGVEEVVTVANAKKDYVKDMKTVLNNFNETQTKIFEIDAEEYYYDDEAANAKGTSVSINGFNF